MKNLFLVKFDLPFYLRLPSSRFFTWDPKFKYACIIPGQFIGEESFSRICNKIVDTTKTLGITQPCNLLDSPGEDKQGIQYKYPVASVIEDGNEYLTQIIDTNSDGGFVQLKPFTEIKIFLVSDRDILTDDIKERSLDILNHFLDVYRIITQDPSIHRIYNLNTYLIDYLIGEKDITENFNDEDALEILKNIDKYDFPNGIGELRSTEQRIGTLDDIFPGKTLMKEYLDNFAKLTVQVYKIPLHYDLILNAQTQLKRHNYHVSILEAETAFEVYVENTLIKVALAVGNNIEDELNYKTKINTKGKYHKLADRIKGLDKYISDYRVNNKFEKIDNFVDSDQYKEWKEKLYEVRNEVVHGGLREITFEQTQDAIHSAKIAISKIEKSIGELADYVPICADVNHLNNTAGKIEFN